METQELLERMRQQTGALMCEKVKVERCRKRGCRLSRRQLRELRSREPEYKYVCYLKDGRKIRMDGD